MGVLKNLVGYKIRRVELLMSQNFHAHMDPTGVTPALFAALVVISENPGIKQATLGRVLGIARSGVMTLIEKLIALDLAERRPHPEDARSFELFLTPRGARQLPAFVESVADHDRQVYRRLDDGEFAQLQELLSKLLDL
jgi:DNA-binding MarR family transcriptional regulator